MALELENKVIQFLRDSPAKQFNAREIADNIFKQYPGDCKKKLEDSEVLKNVDDLLQQLTAEISSRRPVWQAKHPQLKSTDSRPIRYYYSEKSEESEIEEAENPQTDGPSRIAEPDLYPKLSEYLCEIHGVWSKRIDEKRSSNKGGKGSNRWLYPDLVGMKNLSEHWDSELALLNKESAGQRVCLWSFEVKIKLNRSNLRECYFQAVSNSSWANLGYLVAAEIEEKAMEEFRMLYGLHGIGLIQLNTTNPTESDIKIPARERSEINWETANRLIKENKDFKSFICNIRQFFQTGSIKGRDWDYARE